MVEKYLPTRASAGAQTNTNLKSMDPRKRKRSTQNQTILAADPAMPGNQRTHHSSLQLKHRILD